MSVKIPFDTSIIFYPTQEKEPRQMKETNEKITLYQKIVNDIIAIIESGSFSYDQPICTENSLMQQYGFSRITVRRAMAELENKGILYRKRGVGSFVNKNIGEASGKDITSAHKLFAFVFPFNISSTGLIDAFQAASDYLLSKGCYASVFISEDDEKSNGGKILDKLLTMDIAGVAYYPRTSNIHLDKLNSFLFSGKPVVIMDVPSKSPYIPSVISDNLAGSAMLTEHLIRLGHKKIAYISGVSPEERPSIEDRIAGYVLEHRKNDLPLTAQFIRTDITKSVRSAPLLDPGSFRALLDSLVRQGVTAIMAEHDAIAYYILLCCREMNIRVPDQLSVCGFDNSEWATALSDSNPPLRLTTVAQDQAAIGRKVAQLLYEGLDQPIRQVSPSVIPVTLVEGNTTGKAPDGC